MISSDVFKSSGILQVQVYDKSGIYKPKCSDCPKFYKEQTGRSLI